MAMMAIEHLVGLLRGVCEGLIERKRQRVTASTTTPSPAPEASTECLETKPNHNGGTLAPLLASSSPTPCVPNRETCLLQCEKLASATSELFHFFVLNVFENDIPEQPPLWPEPEEGAEKTVPAVIAYLPSAKARPPPPTPPSPCCAATSSFPAPSAVGLCDYYQPLWEPNSMNSVLFRGPKTIEGLLEFITEHCLLPAPSASLSFTSFPCCCGTNYFNPLFLPASFFPSPAASAGETEPPAFTEINGSMEGSSSMSPVANAQPEKTWIDAHAAHPSYHPPLPPRTEDDATAVGAGEKKTEEEAHYDTNEVAHEKASRSSLPPPLPSFSSNAVPGFDWRKALRALALEVLYHHLVDLDILFGVVDNDTPAYKAAVEDVMKLEKKRKSLLLGRKSTFPSPYMTFTPEEEAEDRADRQQLWKALRRARGERVPSSEGSQKGEEEEGEEEGMMNWRTLGREYILNVIPDSRFF